MISTKGRYALLVMIDLAQYSNGEYIALKDVSARQEISVKYLEQVISLLNRAGFLQSMRGNNGGYKLAKRPSDITAGDILRAAEGSLAPVAGLDNAPLMGDRDPSYVTLDFWKGYDKVINEYVDSVTLQQLVDHARVLAGNDYVI
ncbi:MAG: Rrf2 family transcriptional regulator [Clostridia bacterium]|nr:Rrf2 family transcriptional regulator [Clostridia bacterium]MBQ8469440.1 Rrf2 family transcriptional regulator [Clostridia bacterium]